VRRWLVRHPRFHFVPTSSLWLNLVERCFSELTTKWLQRSAHRSVRELTVAIERWTAAWNESPRPFIWSKTADQILETVAAYCKQINDSGH
jgi:transposase